MLKKNSKRPVFSSFGLRNSAVSVSIPKESMMPKKTVFESYKTPSYDTGSLESKVQDTLHSVAWRDALSQREQRAYTSWQSHVAYDNGLRFEPGTYVTNTKYLLEQFSPENQLLDDINLKSKNKTLLDRYVGQGKQYSDMQSFVNALDKERAIVDSMLHDGSMNAIVRERALSDRNAYDCLIKYICDQENIVTESQKARDSSVKIDKFLKKSVPINTTQEGLKRYQEIEREVVRIQKNIQPQLVEIQQKINAIESYKKLVNDYQKALTNVKDLYFKIASTEYSKLQSGDINAYQLALNKLQGVTKEVIRLSATAETAYAQLYSKYQLLQNTLGQELIQLNDTYVHNPAELQKASQSLVYLYNQIMNGQVEAQYILEFLKNQPNDYLIYKDLLNDMRSIVSEHDVHTHSHEESHDDFSKKVIKKVIHRFLEFWQREYNDNKQLDMSICQIYDYQYHNLSASVDIFIKEITILDKKISNLSSLSSQSNIKNAFEELINKKELLDQLDGAISKIQKNAQQSFPMEITSNLLYESKNALTVCFFTANKMDRLVVKINTFKDRINQLEQKLYALQK